MSAILQVTELRKSYAGVHALDGVSLAVEAGSITGLIGPNGSGKSTAIDCISGFQKLDSGKVVLAGNDITGQVALLDRKKLGLSLTAYVLIGMDRHTPERFEHFQDEIRKCPEVLECCLVTGMDADYQLKVVVPDMDHYQKLLLGTLTRIDGVSSVRSSFVLQQILSSTQLPLQHLRD